MRATAQRVKDFALRVSCVPAEADPGSICEVAAGVTASVVFTTVCSREAAHDVVLTDPEASAVYAVANRVVARLNGDDPVPGWSGERLVRDCEQQFLRSIDPALRQTIVERIDALFVK